MNVVKMIEFKLNVDGILNAYMKRSLLSDTQTDKTKYKSAGKYILKHLATLLKGISYVSYPSYCDFSNAISIRKSGNYCTA